MMPAEQHPRMSREPTDPPQVQSKIHCHRPRLDSLSLRTKLIGVMVLVILLSLGLAGTSFIYQIRGYQRQMKFNQLADLAIPLSIQVRILESAGTSQSDIAAFLDEQAAAMGMRILLLDRQGQVLEDTTDDLTGRQIRLNLAGATHRGPDALVGTYREVDGSAFYFVVGPQRPQRVFGREGRTRFADWDEGYIVALAVPEQSLAEDWLDLAPSLGVAGFIALVLSVGVALVIAGSVARPVVAMTRAAEEMARGNYDQEIPVHGSDEIARLALSFNTMAREIGNSQRLLREFLANASHELKTPLTSIQGFAQAMTDGTLRNTDDYTTAGQVIYEESNRMRRLVDDLLYLSRLEAGQVELDLKEFDLGALLLAQSRRLERQVELAGVRLRMEVPDTLAIVGDERRVEQVVTNLLDNALRFTPPGGTITLEVPARSQAIRIRVHNTGSFISSIELPRVFERFYQADPSRAGEGTGLGLAIVREIVVAHGGTVEAHSHPEAGTEFVVNLPLQGSPAAALVAKR